jgi:predicted ATP-grasp superfamily ATP-dependent carboligase
MRLPVNGVHRRARHAGAILLASNPALTFAAARCLREAGTPFHLVGAGRYPAVRTMRGCVSSTTLASDAFDAVRPEVVALVRQLLQAHPGAVVVPSGMRATLFLAAIESLPRENVFPLSPVSVLLELNDKWRFAALLRRLDVAHPMTERVEGLADLANVDVPFPAIIKPLDASGQQGVRRVETRADLERLVRDVGAAHLLPVLVQPFLPGHDLGVSVLSDHGLVVADRVQEFKDDGSLAYVEDAEAVAMTRAVCAATGLHGVANFDFRRDTAAGRLTMLECNPRLYATAHKSAYSGLNMVDLGMRLARGVGCAPPRTQQTVVLRPSATVRRLVAARSISNIPVASRHAFVAEVRDPISSLLRGAEWRFPDAFRRVTGNKPKTWETFDSHDRR